MVTGLDNQGGQRTSIDPLLGPLADDSYSFRSHILWLV